MTNEEIKLADDILSRAKVSDTDGRTLLIAQYLDLMRAAVLRREAMGQNVPATMAIGVKLELPNEG